MKITLPPIAEESNELVSLSRTCAESIREFGEFRTRTSVMVNKSLRHEVNETERALFNLQERIQLALAQMYVYIAKEPNYTLQDKNRAWNNLMKACDGDKIQARICCDQVSNPKIPE